MSTKIPNPTPAEIRQRCLEIQAGWDAKTERERNCYKPAPVSFAVMLRQPRGEFSMRQGAEATVFSEEVA